MSLLIPDTRLVTANILYEMPDYKNILQSFLWQEKDTFPDFPKLFKFLDFWEKEIEGRLVYVLVGEIEIFKAGGLIHLQSETLH